METNFQLLDCDYILVGGEPIIRLFGRSDDNRSVCAFVKGYQPYFYVEPIDGVQPIIDFLKKNFSDLVIRVRPVERFLPIGYQTNKTKLLKIILKNPARTPTVREELLKQKFVKNVFEADILFKNRFMADYNLHGMKWIHATGIPTSTNTVKTDRRIEVRTIKEIEDKTTTLRYLSVDIETISSSEQIPDPRKDQIIMISLTFHPSFKNKKSLVLVAKLIRPYPNTKIFKNEKEMLENFIRIIDAYDPDIITGYNINNFDIPYLLTRMRENKVSTIMGRCKQKHVVSRKIGIRYRNTITGRIVVDVYELIKESIGKGLLRLKRYGLGDVSKELLGEGKTGVTHSEITKFWNGNEEKTRKLIDYTRKDSELALRLLLEKGMLDKFIELSKVCGLVLQDVLSGGESTRVENLLLREFDKSNFVMPIRPTEKEILRRKEERLTKALKGALVLEPKVGLHTNYVIYLDFKSMYPSIYISFNIGPTTLCLSKTKEKTVKTPYGSEFVVPEVRMGIVPKTIKKLIRERDRIKSKMKKATDPSEKNLLNVKQVALKYMTNAFYGYTGYLRARVYTLDIANAITSCGRYFIQKTKEIVEADKRFTVLYGDTDSVFVSTDAKDPEETFAIGEDLVKKINKGLEGKIQMKIESVFKTLLILSKKRYAGLSMEKTNEEWHEKTVMKGIETVRRDWCNLTGKALLNVLEIVLKEQNPKKALAYIRGVINKLAKNQIPIEDLVITKGISKPLKKYKGMQPHIELVKKLRKRSPAEAPGLGDRVGFVIISGPRLLSKRSEDPEYVKKHKMKIDSKYYIDSQILPPVERVFSAIGFSRSELRGFGKQLSLNELKNNFNRSRKVVLKSVEGFVCSKCGETYRRPPLVGKCEKCGGELLFYSGEEKSKYFNSS